MGITMNIYGMIYVCNLLSQPFITFNYYSEPVTQGKHNYNAHFLDEKNEAQEGLIASLRSHSKEEAAKRMDLMTK